MRRWRVPGSTARRPLVSVDIDADRIELVPIELDEDSHPECRPGRRCAHRGRRQTKAHTAL